MRFAGVPLATLGALFLAAGPGRAQDPVWERSAAALARAEAVPAEAASFFQAACET